MREIDGRFDHDPIILILAHRRYERLVDLQLVHGKLLQIRQRRLAGAVIVDGEVDSHFTQGGERVDRPLWRTENRAFGDLQCEAGWVAARPGEQSADLFDEISP